MATKDNQFLSIRDLVIEFRNKGKKFQAVKGVNFDINKGEIFGLVGESGSGKTTIGRAIVGVQPVKDGTVYLEGQTLAGKPTNLYALNKEIYKRIKNIELKTIISTSYINNFLNSLKKSYEEYENDEVAYTSEKIAKILKKSNINFVDSVILANLKYVNRIIYYFNRINQFIEGINEYIPAISVELEKAILNKNTSTKAEFLKVKDVLDDMYHAILEVKLIIKKFKAAKSTKFGALIEAIFKELKIVTAGQKELLQIIPVINSLEFQNLVLSEPQAAREKHKQHYYKMVYVARDEFFKECLSQLNNLVANNSSETQKIKKYEGYIKDFWSKNNMNIHACEAIVKQLVHPKANVNLTALANKLKETNFENKLRSLIADNSALSQKEAKALQQELAQIVKVVKANIVKDEEMIFEYYGWKNIVNNYELESRESIIELTEFLELPSIDEAVRNSSLYKKPSREDRRANRRNVQMIFQDPGSSLNDRMAIEEIISEGLENFPELYKSEAAKQDYVDYNNKLHPDDHWTVNDIKNLDVKKHIVLKLITSVGLLPEHLSRYPHEFSGGQRQRVGIARSLAMQPKIIVADEPISALDVSIRAQVLNLFKKFKEEYDLTYLFITHDLSVVRFIADRIAVIYHGQIVELASAEELFTNPLHPYTKSLLSAVPVPEPSLAKDKELIVYNPEEEHKDYIFDIPAFVEIKKDHFIYANKRELKAIKSDLKNKK